MQHNLRASQIQHPGPTLKDLTCPSTIPNLLTYLIPSNRPSNVASFLPSDINNQIPSGIPFWNGPQETPLSQTSAANRKGVRKGGEVDGPTMFLLASLAVVVLAVYLEV
jgi:hypothetical protein